MIHVTTSPLTIKCSKFKAKMTPRYCVSVCKFVCANKIPCSDLTNAFTSSPEAMTEVVKNHSTTLSDDFKLGFRLFNPICAPELVPKEETMNIETTPPELIPDIASNPTPIDPPKKRRGGFEKGRKLGARKPKVLPAASPDGIAKAAEDGKIKLTPSANAVPAERKTSMPADLGAPCAGDPASSLISFVETAPGSDLYKIEMLGSLYDVMHLLTNSKRHVIVAMDAHKF